jgi:hypothetical protein
MFTSFEVDYQDLFKCSYKDIQNGSIEARSSP